MEVSEHLERAPWMTDRWGPGASASDAMAVFARWSGWVAVATLLPVAGWLAVRRWVAAPSPPPVPATIAAMSGLAVVALLALVRMSQREDVLPLASRFAPSSAPKRVFAMFGSSAMLTLTALLFAFALSGPGQPTWSILGLWTLFTATETWAWRSRLAMPSSLGAASLAPAVMVPSSAAPAETAPSSAAPADTTPASAASASVEAPPGGDNLSSAIAAGGNPIQHLPSDDMSSNEPPSNDLPGKAPATADVNTQEAVDLELEPEEIAECDETELLPVGVVQQWTRGGSEAEGEWIELLTRVDLEPGQRHAVVHLAFCPPLSATPTIHAHVVEGVPAEVAVAEQRVYGARLELRVKQPAAITSDSIVLARAETRPLAKSLRAT